MKHPRLLGLALATACLFLLGSSVASATRLYQRTIPNPNDAVGTGWTWKTTLQLGTSTEIKDEFGTTTDTCPELHIHGNIALGIPNPITGPVIITITSISFTKCTHTTTVIAPGELAIEHISGTTNANVISKGMEVTVQSTFFGASAVVKSGAGTKIGTLTGATSNGGSATLHINGTLNGGILGSVHWTGTGAVTSPTGLVVEAS
jgi:hypothetical protein